jgi:hypothetical protein
MVDIVDFVSISISGIAVIISLLVVFKTRKSEQFRTAFDAQNKLLDSLDEVVALGEAEEKNISAEQKVRLRAVKEAKILQFFSLFEFLELLIINKEVTNKRIISYLIRTIENNIQFLRDFSKYCPSLPKESVDELESFVKNRMY